MAKPYKEGSGWAFRQRVDGQDIYRSGFETREAAQAAADSLVSDSKDADRPAMSGPQRTSVAQALSDYALEVLPYHKGAPQEARRINRYLRALGLRIIQLEAFQGDAPIKKRLSKRKKAQVVHWTATPVEEKVRVIPNGLHAHRAALSAESKVTNEMRRKLARTKMADVTRHELQRFVDRMEEEGFGMSTVRLEVAILRQLFGHAARVWNWRRPMLNPASGLDILTEDNSRERVLTEEEWQKLAPILARRQNQLVFPLVCLMLESAMRSCEPLIHMRWEHVNWERRVLELPDGKTGRRNVPLGPGALAILEYVKALGLTSEPAEQVFPTSYEAVKKVWSEARKEAGVENIQLHDLRHTSATRYSCEFDGDVMKLRVVTGHKTLTMVARYVNLSAEQVATMMHGEELPDRLAPAGLNSDVMEVVQEAHKKADDARKVIARRVAREQSQRRRAQEALKSGIPWPQEAQARTSESSSSANLVIGNVVRVNFERRAA